MYLPRTRQSVDESDRRHMSSGSRSPPPSSSQHQQQQQPPRELQHPDPALRTLGAHLRPGNWTVLGEHYVGVGVERWEALSGRMKRIVVLVALVQLVLLGVFLWIGPEAIFHYTAQVAVSISHLRYGKALLLSLVVVASFPPAVGYGTLISLCGLAYGSAASKTPQFPEGHSVWEGWTLAASGCMLGASVSFVVLRWLVRTHGHRLEWVRKVREDKTWGAMEMAVRRRGWSMVVLIRFCPFPFCYSNLFFASLDSVTFLQFLLSTALITPKLLVHVFLGARTYELLDRDSRAHMDWSAKVLNGVYVVVGALVGFLTSWYVWRETQRILETYEPVPVVVTAVSTSAPTSSPNASSSRTVSASTSTSTSPHLTSPEPKFFLPHAGAHGKAKSGSSRGGNGSRRGDLLDPQMDLEANVGGSGRNPPPTTASAASSSSTGPGGKRILRAPRASRARENESLLVDADDGAADEEDDDEEEEDDEEEREREREGHAAGPNGRRSGQKGDTKILIGTASEEGGDQEDEDEDEAWFKDAPDSRA